MLDRDAAPVSHAKPTGSMWAERLIGLEGLALLRAGFTKSDTDRTRTLEQIDALVSSSRIQPGAGGNVPAPVALAPGEGYDEWADTYDDDLIEGVSESIDRLEEIAVRQMLDGLSPGTTLDAGCGVGRHAAYLAARGHTVVGIDVSGEMIRRAATAVPEGEFSVGSIERLPYADGAFDAALCALALSHLPDPSTAVAEISRVTRPQGPVVISVPHPFSTAVLGLKTLFMRPDGTPAYVREFTHLHCQMIDAFTRAGLRLCGCVEPTITDELAATMAPPQYERTAREALAGLPVFVVWSLTRE